MSFWKQDPPNPTEALRFLGPILESVPTAWATSSTSAPVASQMADMALMEEILADTSGKVGASRKGQGGSYKGR